MKQGCRLAVVADRADTHAVLEAVLSPRGHSVTRLRRYSDLAGIDGGENGCQQAAFDLVVLDADAMPSSAMIPAPLAIPEDGEADSTFISTPRPSVRHVVLGSATVGLDEGSRRLAKPYHMAELLKAIESLLPAA